MLPATLAGRREEATIENPQNLSRPITGQIPNPAGRKTAERLGGGEQKHSIMARGEAEA